VRDEDASLLVDLYELTMAASFHAHMMDAPATFELSIRSLPPGRAFLLCAGLEDVLAYLESFRFESAHLNYLRSLNLFRDDFLARLAAMRFEGEVHAMPEGEVAFAGEPLLRVTAPLVQAQIVETFVLNQIAHQTAIASKAARVVLAAEGRAVVEFSARRTHGTDAAVKAARAAWIAGCAGTSNVLAGKLYGLPLFGTMAHSYVLAFDDEADAFEAYSRDFPDSCVLLIDTFDVAEGARKAAEVGRRLKAGGHALRAVRVDSGDLAQGARVARDVLDEAGLEDTTIFLSGDLNEDKIGDLLRAGAPADAFGVGTDLGTSADAPALGAIYKLVEMQGRGRAKRSIGKATLPGVKQVYRQKRRDVLALAQETIAGRPLLDMVMSAGRRLRTADDVHLARERAARSMSELPDRLKSMDAAAPWPVEASEGLRALDERVRHDA
jgi:nicotinate phosphoribosyltransferase